jgi:hypothetical protein
VFDNNSGTYTPDKRLLGRLKGLMEGNLCGGEVVPWDERKYDYDSGYEELTSEGVPSSFTENGNGNGNEDLGEKENEKEKKSPSGFHIVVYDREDPRREASVKATREYALRWRGVKKEEFVPMVKEGEVTLMQKVSMSLRRPTVAVGEGLEGGVGRGGMGTSAV